MALTVVFALTVASVYVPARGRQRHKNKREAKKLAARRRESVSPLNVLARGYSLTRTLPEQQVVRSIAQVQVGDAVEIIVHDGLLTARVEAQSPRN